MILSIVLTIAFAIALLGWLTQYINALTLVWYLMEKGFPLPSDADIKKGTRYVIAHLLKDLRLATKL